MTLSDIIREVGELGCRSQRIQSDIKGFVNRAHRAIAQRRNWTWMHSHPSVTILAGATSANLPATFKELAAEKSPISYTDPSNPTFPFPVHIKSRAEIEAMPPGYMAATVSTPSAYGTPYFLFLEQNDAGSWTINISPAYPAQANLAYAVSCYLYPAALSLGTDTSTITTDGELAEALINKTKSLAYFAEDPSDARGIAAMQLYEQHIKTASGQDVRRRIAGRAIHF